MSSTLLETYLAVLSLAFALLFSYLFKKDRDKHKLMFLLIFVYNFFIRILGMILNFEDPQVLSKISGWGHLPITSAILIVVVSNLLKLKDFSKPFKVFLFILATSIAMMLLPFYVNPYPEFLYLTIAIATIAVSSYLVFKRRNIPDFMFLLAMVCFSLAGVGKNVMGSGTEFIVFSYTCAYMLLALVFITSKKNGGTGTTSFFALEKEYEKTQQELAQSRNQLSKAEHNFKSLVNLIADPVVIVDRKGQFLEINDKLVESTGFSKEELLGKNFMKTGIVTKKSKAVLMKNLGKRMMGIEVKPYEIEAKTKGGKSIHLEVNANRIEYENKNADLVLFRDITERKKMETKLEEYTEHLEQRVKERTKNLRENKEKLRSIFNSSPDAIVVYDLAGNMVECNQAMIDFLGISTKNEVIGKEGLFFVAKKDRKKVRKTMKDVLKVGSIMNMEYTALNKDGYEFPAEFSASTIKNPSGKPTGFVFVIKDITERMFMEDELRSYFERLEELVEERTAALKQSQERLVKAERLAAIGQAATMVGHDLRNPLQAIENGLYYIDNELANLPVSQKIIESLQAVHNSVAYADKIVKDLQNFTSKREPLFRKVDINTLVEEAFSHVKTPENVETVIEFGELPRVEVDKDMMERVFVNLAVNGMQAMTEKKGMLKVSTKETNGLVEVRFQDTGVGIKEADKTKIFSPFFTTKAQGMGMGLPVCKRFVEIHDGSITVESKEGEGAIFTVRLPIQRNGGVKLD